MSVSERTFAKIGTAVNLLYSVVLLITDWVFSYVPPKALAFVYPIAVIFGILSLMLLFDIQPIRKEFHYTYRGVILFSVCAFLYMTILLIISALR